MYRREVLEDVGEYSKEFFCVEDYEYWIRILKRYGSIGYIPNVFYLYRLHKNSLTIEKAEQVRRMNSKLHCKYFEWSIEGMQDNPKFIMYLYNQFLTDHCIDQAKRERFEEMIPELKGEMELDSKKKVVIFGAGKNGEKAYELLADRVVAFVDSDPLKCGGQKYGLPIWSPEELKKNYCDSKHQILVSVGADLQLEIIYSLVKMGISQYAIYARIG